MNAEGLARPCLQGSVVPIVGLAGQASALSAGAGANVFQKPGKVVERIDEMLVKGEL